MINGPMHGPLVRVRIKSPVKSAPPCVAIFLNRLRRHHLRPLSHYYKVLLPPRAGINSDLGRNTRDSPNYWTNRLEQARNVEDIKTLIDKHKISRPGGGLDPTAVVFAVDALEALARVRWAAVEGVSNGSDSTDHVSARRRRSYSIYKCLSLLPSSTILFVGQAFPFYAREPYGCMRTLHHNI